jgi:hypothetical protein
VGRRRPSFDDLIRRCRGDGRDALPSDPRQNVGWLTPGAAPLIVCTFRRVRRSTSTEAFQTFDAGRAGVPLPSEAVHRTRPSDVLTRIARERVPTVPHVAKTRRNVRPGIARERVPTCVAAKLIADANRQENVVSYRWRVALDAELAPLDNEINIGTGVRFTFRIFTLANLVGPKRQWFRDPMER